MSAAHPNRGPHQPRNPPADPPSGAEEMLRIDDALCFALYTASHAVTNLYRPLLEEVGLTYPQYLVMLALWERDDVPIKALAAQLKLDHGTLSPMLKRLDGAGLITRVRPRQDERTVRISLTPAGDALRTRALCIPPEIAAAMDLDASAFAELRRTLQTLAETVERHRTAPTA